MQGAARRALAARLPEEVAAAVIEFLAGPLCTDPRRVGKPLAGPLAGCRGARRGTYRIIYRVDVDQRVVQVLDIDHRAAEVAAIRVAQRRHVLDRLRAEAAALTENSDYQADVRAARAQMGAGDAW